MKLILYIDAWPGMNIELASAYANPGEKLSFATRYKIEVELPDPHKPDIEVPAEDVKAQPL